ncbi:hypothetical protein J3A83DRAFT_4188443 [Scleroderma citrinum]
MATIAGTCGALLLGGLVAFGLSGCVNMQFAMYWRVYPKDTWQTKSLVTLTWIVDISHSVFIAISLWDSIIGPNGDFSPEQLNKIPWSVAMAAEFGVRVQAIFSLYGHSKFQRLIDEYGMKSAYLYLTFGQFLRTSDLYLSVFRVFLDVVSDPPLPSVQKHWLVAVPVATLAFCRLVAATGSIWLNTHFCVVPSRQDVFGVRDYSESPRIEHEHAANTPHFDGVDHEEWVDHIYWCSCITYLCKGIIMSVWAELSNHLQWLRIHFVMGKLYANSLLATLNSRERIRRPHMYDTSAVTSPAVFFPQDFGMDVSDSPVCPKGLGHPIQVNVECSTVSMVDRNAVTSSSNMVSEQIHLENRYQKGEAPV